MADQRRNVLLVSFDDCISYWPYKTAFNEPLQTPNLDRICAQSSVFHAAYCQAPICGPSRASFMSGRTPHQLGIHDNDVTLFDRLAPADIWPSSFKAAGYFCSSGGKVYHTGNGMLPGPLHRQLYSDRRKRFSGDMRIPKELELKSYGGNRKGWATTDPKDDVTFYDHEAATSAIEFLEGYDADAPFYREIGFFSPHGPHVTPARFKEMYDEDNFRPPPDWDDGFDENAFSNEHMEQNEFLRKGDWSWWRKSVRNYFSALSHGDYQLGRVWDALRASRHADNTVVIILSDHGFHLGNRNLYRKTTLWEQVARVPLIVFDPARGAAQDISDPVALLDVGPTVLDLAGLPPVEAPTSGRSLVPLLDGARDPARVVPTFHRASASIRQGAHRLILYGDGTTQLFDLEEDFWQLRDLGAAHPAHAPMMAALKASCEAHAFPWPEAA
ncbi:MAG: sulfatase-like hydrolase/transferase [Pseudomonadota bacterium]